MLEKYKTTKTGTYREDEFYLNKAIFYDKLIRTPYLNSICDE